MKVIILLPAFGRDAPSGRIGKMPHDPKSACEKWTDRSTGTSLHKEVLFFQRGIRPVGPPASPAARRADVSTLQRREI